MAQKTQNHVGLYLLGFKNDVVTCIKYLVNRFRGYSVLTPQNCHFLLTYCGALESFLFF